MAMPRLERIRVILRPLRSANRPQKGAAKQTMRKVIPMEAPDHREIDPVSFNPMSWK